MTARRLKRTAVYLVCFHSAKPASLGGAKGQYRIVEAAIRNGEWPYDNGDDPSFYVARRGGPLSWGVCRQHLRNAIAKGSIVVFFSFTPVADGQISYRLCAVGTVADKVDHCAIHQDRRFLRFRHLYINGLIEPKKRGNQTGWHYSEEDRPPSQRHKDWLWRIADHRSTNRKEQFEKRYASIYRQSWFCDALISNGGFRLGYNYVVFSPDFIAPNPPEVAISTEGKKERWINKQLKAMTVDKAGSRGLRVENPSGRYVHQHIRFEIPAEEARAWRDELIHALKADKYRKKASRTNHRRANPRALRVKC